MNKTIFIPSKIKVGFQKRTDTYTGSLAYIIYFDSKGKIRKETSWESWRDKKIEPQELSNEPISGFVLNKKVGGNNYSWNPRQTYTRVYDPRGFEFEITIPNLLYILENTNSIKGKGLEGDFVYGWDGKDLLLIPVDAPEYMDLKAHSNLLCDASAVIKGKDLLVGSTYLTDRVQECVYLGRFDYFDESDGSPKGKRYFFHSKEQSFFAVAGLKNKIVKLLAEGYPENFADLIGQLERLLMYSPLDLDRIEYKKASSKLLAQRDIYYNLFLKSGEFMVPVQKRPAYYGTGIITLARRSDSYTYIFPIRYDETEKYRYESIIRDVTRKYSSSDPQSWEELMKDKEYEFYTRVFYLKNGRVWRA